MKKIIYTTPIILLALTVVSLKFTGCEQEDLDFYIDCDYCMEFVPDSAELIVTVTINDENPFVPLTFYSGDYEDGNIDFIDTTWTEERLLYSAVGVEYSVKATYKQGDETIVAIDGDKLRVVDGSDDCASTCYYIRGGTMDLRLK